MTAQSETESWTIRRLLTWTQQRFAQKHLGSPRLDAELLLGHSLGCPRIALYTSYEKALEAAELERYRGLIKRRLQGEPVAYLIGQKEFYSLVLQVTEAVLIPRPETELLVDQALAMLPPRAGREAAASAPAADRQPDPAEEIAAAEQQVPAERGVDLTVHYEAFVPAEDSETAEDSEAEEDPDAAEADAAPVGAAARATPTGPRAAAGGDGAVPSAGLSRKREKGRGADSGMAGAASGAIVADVGTGSGAIALAIKHERPDVRMLAIDRSDDALQVAAKNAERLGLTVEFFHGDLLAPLPPTLRLDMITANLPYIPSAEIATLAAEVRSEPHEALDGGPDGLDLVRRLIDAAPLHLQRGGALLLEIGAGQNLAVEALLRAGGFVDVQSHQDLAQIPRVVVGRLR